MTADTHHDWNRLAWWHWVAPLGAAGLLALKAGALIDPGAWTFLALAVVLLGGAVFAAVHHAEVLAVRIGEPFGSILLALAITTIEVGLIISMMRSGSAGSGAIARDTVISVVMIVLNGIVGLCLLTGAWRHREQEFRVQGAAGILSVIATLSVIALVLPNFPVSTAGPTYSRQQLIGVSLASLSLYILFVFVQTVRHREHFIVDFGPMEASDHPGNRATTISAVLLALSLVVVILLAKALSPTIETVVRAAGLPASVVGVVIAMVVLLPEGVTAVKAAARNRLQTSLNASLGSALASIGLTIPIVGTASLMLGVPLTLGLSPESCVLLMLTLLVSTLTFSTGRTTVLQGGVHLVLFFVFLMLSAMP